MVLQITNPRVETLAREPDVVETLLAIGKRCRALPDLDSRHADEILDYDEAGACHKPTVHKA